MSKDNDKKSQLHISNEGLCGPSIPISRADFEKAREQVIKSEFESKPQNNNTSKDKTQK